MPYAILIIKVPETIARVSACIAVRYLQMYVQHRGTTTAEADELTAWGGNIYSNFFYLYMQQWWEIQHNLSRNRGILLKWLSADQIGMLYMTDTLYWAHRECVCVCVGETTREKVHARSQILGYWDTS